MANMSLYILTLLLHVGDNAMKVIWRNGTLVEKAAMSALWDTRYVIFALV